MKKDMNEDKKMDWFEFKNDSESIIPGFLAYTQNDNGSWNDLLTETALIIEKLREVKNLDYDKTCKKGVTFTVKKLCELANEIENKENLEHSLDSNCITFGLCLKSLSGFYDLWKDKSSIIKSSYEKLANTLRNEISSLNNYAAVVSMLYPCSNSTIVTPNEISKKLLDWLLDKLLINQTDNMATISMGSCLSHLFVNNKQFVEEAWNQSVSQRTDKWKNTSLQEALNELLEIAFSNSKNELTDNYSMMNLILQWAKNCDNKKIKNELSKIIFTINSSLLFEEMLKYSKDSQKPVFLNELIDYLSILLNSKEDYIIISSELKEKIESGISVIDKKTDSRFIKKWKVNGLVITCGAVSVVASALLSLQFPGFPWLAALPWIPYGILVAIIYK